MWRGGTGGGGLSCPETKPSQAKQAELNKTKQNKHSIHSNRRHHGGGCTHRRQSVEMRGCTKRIMKKPHGMMDDDVQEWKSGTYGVAGIGMALVVIDNMYLRTI